MPYYRIFDPERDSFSKLDHVSRMLDGLARRQVEYRTVLMDAWYATVDLMIRFTTEEKIFFCPLKKNRLVDDSFGVEVYKAIADLT